MVPAVNPAPMAAPAQRLGRRSERGEEVVAVIGLGYAGPS